MIDAILNEPVTQLAAEVGGHILLKASCILAATGILTHMFKRSSASMRYVLWSTTFLMLILLPLTFFIPASWQLVSYEENWRGSAGETGAGGQRMVGDVREVGSISSSGSAAPVSGKLDEGPGMFAGTRLVSIILLFIWIGGVLFFLLRLAIHLIRVTVATRRAVPVPSQDIWRLADSVKVKLGIGQPVGIRFSDEISMPFAWGWRKPIVVLPSDAGEWSESQQRSVLIHELAHVARRDYPLHLIAEVACALYWPNPLIWLAARCSAMERERACDDLALQNGTPCDEYAKHLLHIARSQLTWGTPVPVTTMAGENSLTERIQCVMNKKLDHSSLDITKIAAISCVFVVLMLPLMALDVFGLRREIPDIREITRDLREHRDRWVRQRAAWWLGEHEDRSGVMPLVEALDDGSPEVRQVAAWALGEIKDRKAILPLIGTLEDNDPLVREMAVLSLGEIEDPDAVEALFELSEKEHDMRAAVVWALGEIENRGSREAGRARDRVFDRWGRRAWENDLVWTGALMGGPFIEERYGENRVDERAIAYTENVMTLLRRMQDEDADVRLRATLNCGLVGIHDEYESMRDVIGVVDGLLKTLRDPEPEVRAMAVWALDEINPSRSRHFHQDHDQDHDLDHDHGH